MNATKQQAAETRWATERGETLTVAQKIIRAAGGLGDVFHESDLVLACWKSDPAAFGLRHHETVHPDANRIRCYVQGRQRLTGRGWMVNVGECRYALTPSGRGEARRLAGGDTDRRILGTDWIPPDLDEDLCRLYDSEAYRRRVVGRDLRLSDALAWWGCDDADGKKAVQYGSDLVGLTLADAAGHEGVRLSIGVELSEAMLDRLRQTQAVLVGAFGRKVGIAV